MPAIFSYQHCPPCISTLIPPLPDVFQQLRDSQVIMESGDLTGKGQYLRQPYAQAEETRCLPRPAPPPHRSADHRPRYEVYSPS